MSDLIDFLNTFVSLILFSVGVVLVLYPIVALIDGIIGRKNAKKRTESVKPFPPAYIDEEYSDGSEEP
jgi:hypothetical protein